MNRWKFEIIRSNTNYLRSLASMHDDDITISEQSNDYTSWYLLSSYHLNELNDPNQIYNRAYKFKLLIDGISYIIHEKKDAYSELVFGDLYNEKDETVFFTKTTPNPLFDFSYKIDKKHNKYTWSPISLLIHKASENSFLLNLILICSTGMEYAALYQALDEIKTFLVTQHTSLERIGFSKNELKRFTGTANNFKILGIRARHGTSLQEPPKKVMDLAEAQTFITEIIRKVLEMFFSIELPIVRAINFSSEDLFE